MKWTHAACVRQRFGLSGDDEAARVIADSNTNSCARGCGHQDHGESYSFRLSLPCPPLDRLSPRSPACWKRNPGNHVRGEHGLSFSDRRLAVTPLLAQHPISNHAATRFLILGSHMDNLHHPLHTQRWHLSIHRHPCR